MEKAIANLEDAGVLSLDGLLKIDVHELAELIRPSGYYNAKARKLKAIASFISERSGPDLDGLFCRPLHEIRKDLLGVYGVGPETADSILLYAGGPSFVDAYTAGFLSGWVFCPVSYEEVRRLHGESAHFSRAVQWH